MPARKPTAKRLARVPRARVPRAVPDVRKEISSWSREKLVEFALEVVDSHAAIRRQLEDLCLSKGDIGKAADRLKAQIDRDLLIEFIGEREAYEYVRGLDDTLAAIKSLGNRSPGEALDLVWYFLNEIPAIFEDVHDECELGDFCGDLMRAAVSLCRAASASEIELGHKLLDAYVSDMHGYCRFDDALDLLVEARLSKAVREALAAHVKELVKGRDKYDKKKLSGFAGKLLRQRTSTRG